MSCFIIPPLKAGVSVSHDGSWGSRVTTRKCWPLEKPPAWARIQITRVEVSHNVLFNAKDLREVETHQDFGLVMRKTGY